MVVSAPENAGSPEMVKAAAEGGSGVFRTARKMRSRGWDYFILEVTSNIVISSCMRW